MWNDLLSAERINHKGLFSSIYYDMSLENLSHTTQQKLMASVEGSLNGFSNLRDNQPYCQFVSQQTGYNIDKSFHHMSEAHLVIENSSFTTCKTFAAKHVLIPMYGLSVFALSIPIDDVRRGTPDKLETIISHELGHVVMDNLYSPYDFFDGHTRKKTPSSNTHEENWRGEFTADQLAVAADPYKHKTGATLNAFTKERDLINSLYQGSVINQKTAGLLADFYMTRDTAVLNIFGKATPLINFFFGSTINKTHPSDIARAVKGYEMETKCINFLQKQKI